jgi:hypothetical protein
MKKNRNEPRWHSLAGKKVWVFGGAGYLGSAITKTLDAECELTLCIDLGSRAGDFVKADGLQRTTPITLDTSRIDELEKFVEDSVRDYGVPDGVVNLTFCSSSGKRIEELTPQDFARPFDESVTSFFVLSRAIAEKMKPRGSSSIVHFASMYGVVSPDPATYAPPMTPNPIDYGAIKADPGISWKNKWKNADPQEGEAFPFSSTALVAATDAWHCFKAIAISCILLAILLPFANLIQAGWHVWAAVFIGLKFVYGLAFEWRFAHLLVR